MNLYIAELDNGHRLPIVPKVYESALKIIELENKRNYCLSNVYIYKLNKDIEVERKKAFYEHSLDIILNLLRKKMITNIDKRYATNEGGVESLEISL